MLKRLFITLSLALLADTAYTGTAHTFHPAADKAVISALPDDDAPPSPLKASLFGLHNTAGDNASDTSRQYEPVPLDDEDHRKNTPSVRTPLVTNQTSSPILSGIIDVSLPVRTIIFPFHFHL